jgi:cysteinyl-tRNA synthetase
MLSKFSSDSEDKKDKMIKDLIGLIKDIRNTLRNKKFYEISDNIRERLRELGIDIEDKKV